MTREIRAIRIETGREQDRRAWRRLWRILHVGSILVIAATASAARAWGVTGHRVVGELAQAQLTPRAQALVEALLVDEPEPTLAGIAAWADTVRGGSTARYHYVNLDASTCSYEPGRDCPGGQCLPAAFVRYAAILADRTAPRAQRAQALKWVVHLVGDAHQPLHVGGHADRGGNLYQVRWEGRGTNLHALWDSGLLKSMGGSAQDIAERLAQRPVADRSLAIASWMKESCSITAQAGFYPDREPGRAYLGAWRGVVEQRLVQAGARLAALLNGLAPDADIAGRCTAGRG